MDDFDDCGFDEDSDVDNWETEQVFQDGFESEEHACDSCGDTILAREAELFQANGGDGFPACCEECAEVAALPSHRRSYA